MPRDNSAALALWRRAPKAEGLTVELDKHIDEFWRAAGKDASIHLEDFLRELAARIRNGHADIRERMLAARLIERQCKRPLPRKEKSVRRARAIADFVALRAARMEGHRIAFDVGRQEAAIVDAMKQFKCSRRTVFNALTMARKEASGLMLRRTPVQRK
jgi:hypothetical protein